MISDSDAKALSRKTKVARLDAGDVLLHGASVYRVSVYNQTKDTVLLTTTNDEIVDPGWIRRVDLRKQNFFSCPLELRGPAVQVFELDESLSSLSIEALHQWRTQHLALYERLQLASILTGIESSEFRVYAIPEAQANAYPQLKGKAFNIPYPFHCIGKANYLDLAIGRVEKNAIKFARSYSKWPVIYVSSRY